MGDYSKLIANLKLTKELKKSAERDDIPAEEVEKLVALVNSVADQAGPLLERIPATFKQYTEHNIRHCRNLIDLMGRFIPRETLRAMNALELCVLILSALLHDFGMFVSDEEKSAALESVEFESFLAGHHDRAMALEEARRSNNHKRAEIIQDTLLAEYFRRLHPERARDNIKKNLGAELKFGDVDITEYVSDVCESHAWGVHESNDPKYEDKSVSKLSTNKAVYGHPLNLQYIACCLRLADIMDFDRSRTPLVVFQNIDFTEAKSWEEWNKHLSVKGWVINERDVMFRTECREPAFYVAVMEFLDWVDFELSECRRLIVKEAPRDISERYKLHLPPIVDRSEVEMEDKSYLAGAFRFQLDYERIMRLLMDKSLYPDASLFLRELLQNSLDACRNREAHAKEHNQEHLYTPRIAVWDYSDDKENPRVIFQDNGMGMSRKIVENYFMRVGRSYYRSPEFDAERAKLRQKGIELEATSQFGIGILSCFMVADRFEVETYRTGNNPLHIIIEGPTKYFTIKLLSPPPQVDFQSDPASDLEDGPPHRAGTRITVHLRPDTKLNVDETLNTFAVNVDYDINVYQGTTSTEPLLIPKRRWEDREQWRRTLGTAIYARSYQYDARITEQGIQNLNEVLTLSPISFEKYEFSRNLRGGAWLWLLRGEGDEVCVESGDLRIEQEGLVLTGLPGLLGTLTENRALDSPEHRDAFSKRLESSLTDPEKLWHAVNIFISHRYDTGGWIKRWNSLSDADRNIFLESVKSFSPDSPYWFNVGGIPSSLLRGGREWAGQPFSFTPKLESMAYPRDVALHGILLPAGFLEWNPMTGESNKPELMDIPGGIQLDAHGPAAPVPAASRLFADIKAARHTLALFMRAVIRHAFELASANSSKPGWSRWLHSLFSAIGEREGWVDAVLEELALFETHLPYIVRVKGEIEYLSSDDVIQQFGRWVPISAYVEDEARFTDGIVVYSSGSAPLLASKELRQKADGRWEVDMSSRRAVDEERIKYISSGQVTSSLIHSKALP